MKLTINRKSNPKGKEKLSPVHFDLFFNGNKWHGKSIAQDIVLAVLRKAAIDGERKLNKAMQEITHEQEDYSPERVTVECDEDTTIIDRITLVKNKEGTTFNLDDLLIRGDYLPNDDNAPQRVLDIITEFKDVLGEFLTAKISDINSECSPSGKYPALSAMQDEDGTWFLGKYNEDHKPYEDERDSLPVDEVIEALFFYTYTINQEAEEENHAPVKTTSGKKYLKGAVLQLDKDKNIEVVNLDKYNKEVQTVVIEISKTLRIAE